MRKIKITIEYELDDPEAMLETERRDWLEGNVNVHDIVATDGVVIFELVD